MDSAHEMNNEGAIERRAAPRKRKNISGVTEGIDAAQMKVAPFLGKLSQLVETCPPETGGWCDDGLSFLINDESASTTVIPQFFAHTNFRSFCRQLSCCPPPRVFRKIPLPETGSLTRRPARRRLSQDAAPQALQRQRSVRLVRVLARPLRARPPGPPLPGPSIPRPPP